MRDNPPRAAPVQSVMPRGWDEGEGEGEGGGRKKQKLLPLSLTSLN
jgi:hypothetical protein